MLISRPSHGLCQACRNEIGNLLRYGLTDRPLPAKVFRSRNLEPLTFQRSLRHPYNSRAFHTTPWRLNNHGDSEKSPQPSSTTQAPPHQDSNLIDESILEDNATEVTDTSFDRVANARRQGLGIEAIVRSARQTHGEYLPSNTLTEEELATYIRLYGEPAEEFDDLEEDLEFEAEDIQPEGRSAHQLLRDNPDGSIDIVEYDTLEDNVEELEDDFEDAQLDDFDPEILRARAEEIAQQLGGEVFQNEEGTIVDEATGGRRRMHPLTTEGKFSALSKTIFLPEEPFTGPVSEILSEFSNKHISETADRLFGGPGLPSGVATPISRRSDMQVPIGITTTQHAMGEMEANAFIAALWPGMYASVMSVMVEVRKRLGSDWLRKLISKDGGPTVLDVGSGGAAIVAWREIIKAEWQAMYPDEPIELAPLGKATVLTGAETLRHRSALLLENTTFVPRLPDYVHVRDTTTLDDDRAPPQRKQYDIILAPHSLWNLKEEFMRKQHVQNLWSLLSSDGGILVLLEKGIPRGFEVVAAAREMILERFISSSGSETYEDTIQSPGDERFVNKSPGMIVAPCTNHKQCPLYTTVGVSSGRKDLCSFEQRYIRPQYLQRILKAKHRNHEDLRFSYLAVQKGVDLRQTRDIPQGEIATNAAFKGYEKALEEGEVETLSLPRLIYPPIKRRGHVTMDLCTPEGQIERWTVPKSFSKQAHHDARKSSWGDLWALGAKTRIPRTVRLGNKKTKTKEEKLKARAEERAARKEDEKLEEALRAERRDGVLDLDRILDSDNIDLEDNDDLEEALLELEAAHLEQEEEPTEVYGDSSRENWNDWAAEYANGDNARGVLRDRRTGVGKAAKMRDRAGGSKFSAEGLRIRKPTTRGPNAILTSAQVRGQGRSSATKP